jgi:serine/threonine-protein kinase RsbW
MVERLYAGLRAPHRFGPGTGDAVKATDQSVIGTEVFATENCAEIHVSRCGAHVVSEIKGILRELCLKQIAAVNLFLNLEDPSTCAVTPELESLGFYFAGILPRSRVGEALILQYLNNVPLDYARIVAHSDTARELVAYVKSCDPHAA